MTKNKDGVEIIKMGNRLKQKIMGKPDDKPGYLDPKNVEKADKIISDMCTSCESLISVRIKELIELSQKFNDEGMTKIQKGVVIQDIFLLSHEIKDVAAMCKYVLISDFAESLRDFVGGRDIGVEAQLVIMKAHIDAMVACQNLGIRDQGSMEAEELKKMVKVAIDKYS